MTVAAVSALLCLSPWNGAGNQARMLELVNAYRAAHGVEALTPDVGLNTAAARHARFMAANHVLSHFERSDMAGFTGTDLSERARAVGWSDDLSELVGHASTTVDESVQAIFDSPCHRVRFLRPGKLKLGAWDEDNFVCLLIGGSASPTTVVSPPDGATDVGLSWYGAPDFTGTKYPGGTEFGYPLTATFPCETDGTVKVTTAELTAANGSLCRVIVRDPSNDDHYTDSIAIVPVAPLDGSTKYTAHVVAVMPDGKIVARTWSFVTKASPDAARLRTSP